MHPFPLSHLAFSGLLCAGYAHLAVLTLFPSACEHVCAPESQDLSRTSHARQHSI